MGRAAAWDLARQAEIDAVRLLDSNRQALDAAREELERLLPRGSVQVETSVIDLNSASGLVAQLSDASVAISAADYRFNEVVTRAAIAARTHLCDLGGNLTMVDRQLALDALASEAGVTVIPDCGLAPGLACMLAAWGVERLEAPESVQFAWAACRKLPSRP